MGTEKEQAGLKWAIRGPDADGSVWIDIDQADDLNSFNLGAFDDVACRWADWMGQHDFGDRPCPIA